MVIVYLQLHDLIERRASGVDLMSTLECLPGLRDSPCTKQNHPAVEVRQSHKRIACLIEIRGLIQSTTQGENVLSHRRELIVRRLLGLRCENVDARR